MDVAVKVIEHMGTSPAAVQHEMEMMMAFHHPHIVRWGGGLGHGQMMQRVQHAADK